MQCKHEIIVTMVKHAELIFVDFNTLQIYSLIGYDKKKLF